MKHIFRLTAVLATILGIISCNSAKEETDRKFPGISASPEKGWFPLAAETPARIILDNEDYPVVRIASGMLADDVERITGMRPETIECYDIESFADTPAVITGTIGRSRIIDSLAAEGIIDVSEIEGRGESCIISTISI